MGVFICRNHEDYEYFRGTCSECDRLHFEWKNNRLREELYRMKNNYEEACKTIALMHKAAIGEVTGPRRGVVEDIDDVRKELSEQIKFGLELHQELVDCKQELANERSEHERDLQWVSSNMRQLIYKNGTCSLTVDEIKRKVRENFWVKMSS